MKQTTRAKKYLTFLEKICYTVNMEKIFGLPFPNAMIDPLNAPIHENQVRVAWAAVAGGVVWWTIQEMTALDVTTGLHLGSTATTVLAVVAAVLGIAFAMEFVATRYVSATRRVAQLVTAAAIYLRVAVHRIRCVSSATQKQIEVAVAGCRPQERGDTGPAPPGAERAPRSPHNTLIRCAVRRSKETGHRVTSLHFMPT